RPRSSRCRLAEISRQYRLQAREEIELAQTLDHAFDFDRRQDAPAMAGVAQVIGEQGRMHRHDLVSQALQHRHGGRIADMAVGDAGLEGEDLHDVPKLPPDFAIAPASIIVAPTPPPDDFGCFRALILAAACSMCRAPICAPWRRRRPWRPTSSSSISRMRWRPTPSAMPASRW